MSARTNVCLDETSPKNERKNQCGAKKNLYNCSLGNNFFFKFALIFFRRADGVAKNLKLVDMV